MADKIKQLTEEGNKLVNDMRALNDKAGNEKRKFTDEEDAEYNRMDTEYSSVEAQIKREQDLEKREGVARDVKDDYSEKNKGEKLDDKAEYSRAFENYIRYGNNAPQKDIELVRTQTRAQSVGTDSEGGYTSSDSLNTQVIETMLDYSGIRQVATILNTSRGEKIEFITNDDTSNTGALLAENAQDSEQDLVFGTKQLDAYKYTSRIIRVPIELLQDSEINMNAYIGKKFGQRLGRIENTHMTTGTGSSQPNGVMTAATVGVTAASASAYTFDELYDLQHSIDPAYRKKDSKWMMDDATLKAIRKLKDSNNLYLWNPGDPRAGIAGTIAGHEYVINNDCATAAANALTIAYGDFKEYVIRDTMGITMRRLVERYADYHQVGFVAIKRMDGELMDTAAVKTMKMAAV